VGGVLSSPLFEWANSTVAGTPILQQAITTAAAALPSIG
jgi:NAD(P)H-quinone oxidoreductase subunit 2